METMRALGDEFMATNQLTKAKAALLNTVCLLLMVTAIPINVALWRWAV